MSPRICTRTLLATLLLAAGLPAPGLAVPQILDNNGATVGIVRGTSGTVVGIFIVNGPDLVPIRVERDQLVGPNIGHFKSTDCTGTPYVHPSVVDTGINGLNGRAYVTKGSGSRLYRTKPSATPVDVDIESRWDQDQGGCVPWSTGPGTAPYVPAGVFVRTLETHFPPPYRIVGTP